ncbi:hypothetical protein BvCmsG79A_01564 [Escherichia coli]|nr:hypothetical protein BvCmsG79A_01564 [Escherichia coli]
MLEVRSQQQVSDLRIFGIGIGDFLQELRTDDAASTENLRDFAVVQIPVVLFRRSTQLREALGVRNDFAQIQSTTNFFDELSLVASWLRLRARENFRRGNTLIFQRRDITCKHRLGNQRQRFAEIQRALAGPFTGTFVCCFIQNHINQVVTVFIFFGEDVFGDVDQVAAQFTVIPLGKDLCQFFVGEVQATFKQRIGFSNQLHITVFNTVVNHLHIVTCTIGTNIGNAWLTVVSYCGDFGQDRCNQFIGFFLPTRHNGRTFQRTFFTAGNTGTNEVKAFCRKLTVTTNGVLEEGVTAINDDVTFIEIWFEGINSSIRACTCFHH